MEKASSLRSKPLVKHSEGWQSLKVMSLGAHCYTSHLLQEMGLRTEAGPFDWIFSDPRMIADCLDDHFAAFLDPAFYTYTGNPSGLGRGHLHFSPKYQRPLIFNHHDPSKPEDHRHFCRAVERIEQVLEEAQPALFVAVMDPRRGVETYIREMHAALQRRSPFASLLVILTRSAAENGPTATCLAQEDSMAIYQVGTTSLMEGGLSHANPADDQLIMDIIGRHLTDAVDEAHHYPG